MLDPKGRVVMVSGAPRGVGRAIAERLLDQDRPVVDFFLDGAPAQARAGDTLLTAILAGGHGHVRHSEFGDGPRAGFCWMGACQDCFVLVEGRGARRACGTLLEPGMKLRRR